MPTDDDADRADRANRVSNACATDLVDLPNELLDHIVAYLPTVSSLTSLGRTNKRLNLYVNREEPWKKFVATRFPSLHPNDSPSWRDTARSLTTLSRAHDRRAILARDVAPTGDVLMLPQRQRAERRPGLRGQTMGFVPQLDVTEVVGSRWSDREEVLVYSAGPEIVLRKTKLDGSDDEEVNTSWTTYKPFSAEDGKDDVVILHLVHSDNTGRQRVVTGTANGDLQLLSLPDTLTEEVSKTYFTTQGMPIRSSSLLKLGQNGEQDKMLAVNLGDFNVALYDLTTDQSKIAPLSQIDLRPSPANTPAGSATSSIRVHRIRSTQFLSPSVLALGLGPHTEPIRIHSVRPTGLDSQPLRRIGLVNTGSHLEDRSDEIAPGGVVSKPVKSVYPIIPLPSSSGSSVSDGNIFLSGGYDGIVRLHDLRSPSDVETSYIDPTDDSSVYSLLAQGRERLLVGASRHSLLKVFDLRLGSKCYDYTYAANSSQEKTSTNGIINQLRNHEITQSDNRRSNDYNIFLTTSSASTNSRRSQRGWGRYLPGTIQDSSVYSLASASPSSSKVYAGIEYAVLELSFTGLLDSHPDPVISRTAFRARPEAGRDETVRSAEQWLQRNHILDLSMYDHRRGLQLLKQSGVRPRVSWADDESEQLLDERWDV